MRIPSRQSPRPTWAGEHACRKADTDQVPLTADDVPHGEVIDLPAFGLAILSFSDPDGVHLELTAVV